MKNTTRSLTTILSILLFTIITLQPIRVEATVDPLVDLVQAEAIKNNFHEATFRLTIQITAPLEHAVYVDRTETPLLPHLYFNPGNGTRWVLEDAPGSPPRDATLFRNSYKRLTGTTSGDNSSLWYLSAGESANFMLTIDISMNPFEEEMPTRFLQVVMTHVNWGTSSSELAPYFLELGPEFKTPYAIMGHLPEPGTATLLLTAGGWFLSMRRRRKPKS